MLAIFSADGHHITSIPVDADRGTFHMSQHTDDVFIVKEDPYPQVVRLRLADNESH
jgi:hypothetical protein